MKALKYIAAVAVIGLAACQNDDLDLVGYNSDPNAVQITATVGNTLTRSNPTEDTGSEKATLFKEGDVISVKTDDQDAVGYVLNGTKWEPANPNAYLVWNKSSHEFKAWYPANKYTGFEPVPARQDTPEAIADADFMSFKGTFSQSGTINIRMERQTTRFIISGIDWGRQYVENNVATHTVEEIRVNCIGTRDIEPFEKDGKYYVLLNPGAAVDDTFITITLKSKKDGSTATETVRGIPAVEAGTSYSCSLIVGKDKTELGKVTLEDWETSVNIWSGTATDNTIE